MRADQKCSGGLVVMARFFRPAVAGFLLSMALLLGIYGVASLLYGGNSTHNVVAQTSSPSASTPGSQPAAQPVTASPIDTIQSFLDAVQAGDMDVVSNLTGGTGGSPGVVAWSSTDLTAYVGHTTFGRWRHIITHNNGINACVNIDGFMTFTDPGAFPNVKNVSHFWIDGDFKLKASGNSWIITSLPGYQQPTCDEPSHYGPDPHPFPVPGDPI